LHVNIFLANRFNKNVLKRLFNNPTDNTIDCPSVYAGFPRNLRYEEVAHCKPEYNNNSGEFWDEKAFYPSALILENDLDRSLPYSQR
jgi:transposase-like protein